MTNSLNPVVRGLRQTTLDISEALLGLGNDGGICRNRVLQFQVCGELVLLLLEKLQHILNRSVATAADGDVGAMVFLAILDVQVGDAVVMLLDEGHGVVVGGSEVA